MNSIDPPETIQRIKAHLGRGRLCEAHECARAALASHPGHPRLGQLYALTLARLGATERARELLETLFEQNPADAETAGLLGRVYKDLWRATGDNGFARRSRDIYMKGFEVTGDPYPGINAAGMSRILGDAENAHRIAWDVLRACGARPRDYWTLATAGEAELLLGNADAAAAVFHEALTLAGGDIGAVNSTYRQLRLYTKYFPVPDEILKAYAPPGVAAFTGHMIDRAARAAPRFPESAAESVKQEIAAALERLNARIGYASAACGADILFLEAMRERGGETNVLLPFRMQDFIETSVRFAGAQWVRRFHDALDAADSVSYVTEEGYLGSDDLFAFAGGVTMGLSALRAASLDTRPHLVCVWNAADTDGRPGGAAHTLDAWPFKDRVHIIDPSGIPCGHDPKLKFEFRSCPRNSQKYSHETDTGGDSATRKTFPVPFGIQRTIKCILFADIVGFSRMQEEQTPFFMYEFLRAFAERIERFTPRPEILNTWGDAIFAVHESAPDMAAFAFALRDLIADTDWAAKNLPGDLNARIALHAGPVFTGEDPVLRRGNAFGAHINRAARMEPVAVPGCVYASEQFAALLAMKCPGGFVIEYVGVHDLPKDFGTQAMYHIRKVASSE